MSWQPIDFQGIVSLDTPVIDLLRQYLDEQESFLGQSILEAIPPDIQAPILGYSHGTTIKLSEAIETFSKRCSGVNTSSAGRCGDDWKPTRDKINKALWQYVEVLEGCTAELFQQVEQIGLEQWHSRLPHVVGTLKEILQHKIEDLMWAIKRLENLLWRYRLNLQKPTFINKLTAKASQLFSSILDKELLVNLNKTQTFLNTHYSHFLKHYGNYVKLQEEVEKSLEKFEKYPSFLYLDRDNQRLFKKLYQLLKLWDMNRSAKAVPSHELTLALRHILSIEKATALFKEYYTNIKSLLFDQSKTFKNQGEDLLHEDKAKAPLVQEIANCQSEIHMLGSTISHYRDFLLRADPDPYVRSRLGFSEWIVGPEPTQTKPLLDLGYDMEHLDSLCNQLAEALKEKRHAQVAISEVEPSISRALHEMSQPLSTKHMTRSRAEQIISHLQQLNEWTAFSWSVVDYIGQILSKLLRVDWKHHIVFESTAFHQLYAVHQGLEPVNDRSHQNRLNKLGKLLHKIQDWVIKHRTQSHFHDIELDMHDIKIYLQDFLAFVQRISSESSLPKERMQSLFRELSQELLEYRYLFGNFFAQLRQHESEGQLIRRQFLFVDQYFETIELKLKEIEKSLSEIPQETTSEPDPEPEQEENKDNEE